MIVDAARTPAVAGSAMREAQWRTAYAAQIKKTNEGSVVFDGNMLSVHLRAFSSTASIGIPQQAG